MKKMMLIMAALVFALFSISTTPIESKAASATYYNPATDTRYFSEVNQLRIRTGPGSGYKIVGKISKYTEVDVISRTGQWYKIWYKGNVRYVSATYIMKKKMPRVLAYGAVSTDGANLHVRTSPSTSARSLGKLKNGKEVRITNEYYASGGYWYSIIYKGRIGYVYARYVWVY